jgi:hypothetical protein
MKYQVLKRLDGSTFAPSFVNEFARLEDARQYVELSQRAEDDKNSANGSTSRWLYYAVEVL